MDKFSESLKRVFELQDRIADLHPLLEQTFPAAILSDGELWLYRPEASARAYRHVGTVQPPFPLPDSVMSAFPLEELGGEPAAVVTEKVFDSLEGYVSIFHEFVHCYQAATCEGKLKSKLEVARVGVAQQSPVWELEYPFPYDLQAFVEAYKLQLEGDLSHRAELRQGLGKLEYEYLAWQEWKEGFARWLENRVRLRLGLPSNDNGAQEPYNRITFYAGGAALIEHFVTLDPASAKNLERLFWRILEYPA